MSSHQWHVGMALGLGAKQNPLRGGDDIPLVVLPDIAWYGDNAYFDNVELGYQWVQQMDFALETFIRPNTELAYFKFWHPANVFYYQYATYDQRNEFSSPPPGINDIAKRHWAVDVGLRAHWYRSYGEWQLAVFSAPWNTYNGQHGSVTLKSPWQIGRWRLQGEVGVEWKSSALLDYYYGLHAQDGIDSIYYYHADSGWFYHAGILLSTPLDQNWQAMARISYQHLPGAMANSPIVVRKSVASLFVGVAYHF